MNDVNDEDAVSETKGTPKPTAAQIALARFGDECEASSFKPSHYYRLLPQIIDARAAIAKATGDA